jgi:multidrug efflux pump subunit AcrB
MNLFGRTWQVQVQAEAQDRASLDDISRVKVRNDEGKMVPLRSLVETKLILGPQTLIRYNNKCAVVLTGPAPGVSSGQGRRWSRWRRKHCRQASRSSGPTSLIRNRKQRGRRPSSSASRCCSPICSW